MLMVRQTSTQAILPPSKYDLAWVSVEVHTFDTNVTEQASTYLLELLQSLFKPR